MSAILKLVLLAAVLSLIPQARPESRYRVYFPTLSLSSQDGERIESLEVVLNGGRFCGVSSIPKDWSIQVVSPSSARTVFRASAGHGSTALWNLDEFQGSIAVCLGVPVAKEHIPGISATIVSATQEGSHRHQFTGSQLALKP